MLYNKSVGKQVHFWWTTGTEATTRETILDKACKIGDVVAWPWLRH
jgi:hypothetical protein